MTTTDRPKANDNRLYQYSGHTGEMREEYPLIASLIRPGSTVLDLGCGDGALLRYLRDERDVAGKGVDVSPSGVSAAIEGGIDAVEGRIDHGLTFGDKEFDYAVCNVTIQMVEYPERLLSEMKRVAHHLIVSFPNFGFYRNRLELLLRGRMPRATLFGYSWYATGHIHQLSYPDFRDLVAHIGGMEIVKRLSPQPKGALRRMVATMAPDLFHMVIVVLLSTTSEHSE